MHPKFVHLNVHSEFSLIDSLIRIPRLFEKCKEGSAGAVGLTDSNNLFAAAKFVSSAETAGVKPILGSEIDIVSENKNVEWLGGLIQTTDTLFPSGGYAHSYGLEELVALGRIGSINDLEEFLIDEILPALENQEVAA